MGLYRTGDIIKEYIGHPEGARFDINASGCNLTIFFDSPTADEVQDIKRGNVEYAVAIAHEVIFMLFKFGDQEYMDCPYNINISPDVKLQTVKEGQGYSCNITLINTKLGTIKAMRLISFTTEFSKALKELIDNQRGKEISKKNIIMAYSTFDTDDLVDIALAKGELNDRKEI